MQTPAQSRDHPATAAARSQPAPLETAPPALQPLDYTSLRAVLSELEAALVPSRFEKAQQSDASTVQLGLRTMNGSQWLELSWLAEAPRLLAIPPPPRQGDGSTLAQQLQHGLRGLALVELHQPAWERVVELRFSPRPGAPVERTLVLELMGRHSNLFLLDGERRVIALARQIRDSQSRLRPIGTGDPYQSPPGQNGEPPRREEAFELWRQRLMLLPVPLGKALLGAYQGTSPALVRQLLADGDSAGPSLAALPVAELQEAQWQRLWQRWRDWLRALEQGRFALQWDGGGEYRCWSAPPEPEETAAPAVAVEPPFGSGPAAKRSADPSQAGPAAIGASDPPPGAATAGAAGSDALPQPPATEAVSGVDGRGGDLTINRALAGHYGGILAGRRWRARRQALGSRLLAAIDRERRQLEQQQQRLAEVPAAEGLQQQADALLCRRDPDRDTIAEAQSLYRRARRLRRSAAAIMPRIDLHQQRLGGLETSLLFLEQIVFNPLEPQGGEKALSALEEELQEQLERLRPQTALSRAGRRAGRRQSGQADPQPLELRSASGLRLQVGRNHRQNEWISLRQARRGDLWFHAQEQPGSHVVLKGSEAPPQEADLQAAADLAAHFSRGRGNRRVPVQMVAAETLQRIPGAEPGTVRHRGGEVLWGEPERALALLRQGEPPRADLQGALPTGRSAAGSP